MSRRSMILESLSSSVLTRTMLKIKRLRSKFDSVPQVCPKRAACPAGGANGHEVGMRVAIVGTGYVGLVSGACFADFGHHVTCVDKDAAKIAALQRNEIPLYEPGLARIVETNAREGRLD